MTIDWAKTMSTVCRTAERHFLCARKDEKDKSEHVSGVSVITDHLMYDGGSPLRLGLPCVPGGTQQPPALHNNPACFPIGVSTRSWHSCGGLQGHCVILLGTERSGTSEFFATQDNQATSSIFSRQLRVPWDLASPRSTECCPECCPVTGGCTLPLRSRPS